MVTDIDKIPVEVGEYKGLELSLLSIEVPESTVMAKVSELLEQVVTAQPATDGVRRGDVVDLSYTGQKGAEAATVLRGACQGLVVGAGELIPGFEEKLLSHRAGESLRFKLNFPSCHINEDLQGRLVTFDVFLEKVQRKPEDLLTDEVVSAYSEFPTVEALTEAVRAQMEAESDDEVRHYLRTAIEAALAGVTEIDIPEEAVVEQREAALEELREGLAPGESLEDKLAAMGTDPEKFAEDAERQIRTGIAAARALDVVAEREGLAVTADELRAEAARMAEAGGLDAAALDEALADAEVAEAITRHLMHQKALDVVLSHAVIKEDDR